MYSAPVFFLRTKKAVGTRNMCFFHPKHVRLARKTQKQKKRNLDSSTTTPTRFTQQPSHPPPSNHHTTKEIDLGAPSTHTLHTHAGRASLPTPPASSSTTTRTVFTTTATYQHHGLWRTIREFACLLYIRGGVEILSYGAAVARVDRLHPSCRCFFFAPPCGTCTAVPIHFPAICCPILVCISSLQLLRTTHHPCMHALLACARHPDARVLRAFARLLSRASFCDHYLSSA